MTIVTYEKFREDTARMFERAVESAYKDLLEKAVAEAVAAEREACAQVCETTDEPLDPSAAGSVFAEAIRARSAK